MNAPLLSVIIPVYNCRQYLTRAVRSVLLQPDTSHVEILLIDDGSADGSDAICDELSERYPGRVFVHHQQNSGVSAARNYGIEHVSGKYLAFLDSDDWWSPDFLDDSVIRLLSDEKQYDLIEFSHRRVSPDYSRERRFPIAETELDEASPTRRICLSEHWKFFYRRQFILDNGIRYFPVKTCEDVPFIELSSRLARRFCSVNRLLYNYYYNATSAVHTRKTADLLRDRITVVHLKGQQLQNKGFPVETEREELSFIAEFLPALCMYYSYEEVLTVLSEDLFRVIRDPDVQPWRSFQPVIAKWRRNSKRYWKRTRLWPGFSNEMQRLYSKNKGLRRIVSFLHFHFLDHWTALKGEEKAQMGHWLEACRRFK